MHTRLLFQPAPWLFALALVFLPDLVFAQGDGGQVGFDIGRLFTDVAALSAFVVVAVAFVRTHLWKTADGTAALALVFVISISVALAGWYLKLLAVPDIMGALGYGVTAAIMAAGGYKTAGKLASKAGIQAIAYEPDEVKPATPASVPAPASPPASPTV